MTKTMVAYFLKLLEHKTNGCTRGRMTGSVLSPITLFGVAIPTAPREDGTEKGYLGPEML